MPVRTGIIKDAENIKGRGGVGGFEGLDLSGIAGGNVRWDSHPGRQVPSLLQK